MNALLLSIIMVLTQGIPLAQQQAGTIRGVLKDSEGKPAAGIRMAAVAKPESLIDALTGAAMSSIAETDEAGRYALENVPPGRYLIAAGRLDLQTYYPGTPNFSEAKDVLVAAGAVISGIDFSLNDLSFGRAAQGGPPQMISNIDIPIQVTVEGGGRRPVSGNGNVTGVRLEGGGRLITVGLDAVSASVPALPASFRVTVQNLPETFVVKSMAQGSTDLLSGSVQLTTANIPLSALLTNVPLATAASILAPAQTPQAIRTDPAALQAYLAGLAAAQGGLGTTGTQIQNSLSALYTAGKPYTPLAAISIVLAPATAKTTTGVRVSGRTTFVGNRTVFLSGIPGNYYSDGTFEVLGVPPGAHVIATRVNPGVRPLAASLVVGTENLDGVVLEETAMVPDSTWDSAPRPAGGRPPGVVPLPRLSGTVVEEVSLQPIREGSVILRLGRGSRIVFPVSEGRFELPPLLPGTYELEFNVFGHTVVKESIEIADTDIKLDVAPRKLY
jgi:hypothetical protein